MTIKQMKNPKKIWTISTLINFGLVLNYSLLAHQCQNGARAAQNQIPPPPDDYLGALVQMILTAASAIFGLLFLISGLTLIGLIIKDKFFAER